MNSITRVTLDRINCNLHRVSLLDLILLAFHSLDFDVFSALPVGYGYRWMQTKTFVEDLIQIFVSDHFVMIHFPIFVENILDFFANLVLDGFVVGDLKILRNNDGFVENKTS